MDYRFLGINGQSKYGLGRVGVHEVGHFLGLKHIWGDAVQCEIDDGVEDTPQQQSAYIGCPEHPQVSCGSDDLFMNFMDYVRDPCMLMFTEGQKARMLSTLFTYRSGLVHKKKDVDDQVTSENNQFKVFPNPTTSDINIAFSIRQKEVKHWTLFASSGQLMRHGELFVNSQFQITINDLPLWVYFCKIGEITEKIIKL